jgi:hypothetical protein
MLDQALDPRRVQAFPVFGRLLGAKIVVLLLLTVLFQGMGHAQPVEASKKVQQWSLKLEDVRVDRALKRWSKEAGYSFRWDADRYVLIAAPSVYEGGFLDAVRQVLETPGIIYSEYPLEACVYSNTPPLLRITRLGDQAEECR